MRAFSLIVLVLACTVRNVNCEMVRKYNYDSDGDTNIASTVGSITNGVTIICHVIFKTDFFLLAMHSCSLLSLLCFEVVSSFLFLFTCRIQVNYVLDM
jgi:hypothetical protein